MYKDNNKMKSLLGAIRKSALIISCAIIIFGGYYYLQESSLIIDMVFAPIFGYLISK